jgi:hypothetical protein
LPERVERLGKHAGVGDDGHEIGVAVPAGDDMAVQVLGDSRARLCSEIETHVEGDVTQTDLPRRKKSGLREAVKILGNIPGIAHFRFDASDVVRHPLVTKIVDAYENGRREAEDVQPH